MTAPVFGYSSTRPNDDIIAVSGGDFSKLLIVDTSDDADATVFPHDVAVRFTSTDPAYLAKAGSGAVKAALVGANDQLGGKGADVCVVRVLTGTDSGNDPANILAKTQANIVGDPGALTGLWAGRNAHVTCKMMPHIVVAGHTHEPGVGGADNPVRVALAPILEAMKAVAPVAVDASSKVASIAARELMSSNRMLPVGVAAKVYEVQNGAEVLVTRSMAPRIAGLIAATDNNYRNGMPFDSFCNKPILGIAGINRPIAYDNGDGSTEAQLLLAAQVSVVVAGESNNPGAIADGGFYFLGADSAATDDSWTQIHQVRGCDYIDAEFELIARRIIGGRYTPARCEAALRSFGLVLQDHVANADIVGYDLRYPSDLNSISQVMLGNFSIRTKQELYPLIRRINNEVRRYPDALSALVNTIIANAGVQTGLVS